jgi:hypothetical protein
MHHDQLKLNLKPIVLNIKKKTRSMSILTSMPFEIAQMSGLN